MTLSGWIIMALSVGGMTGLLTWCISKVLMTPGSTKHLHTQADIHSPDLDEDD